MLYILLMDSDQMPKLITLTLSISFHWHMPIEITCCSLMITYTENNHHDANFVFTGGTGSCHNHNLLCYQSWHHNDFSAWYVIPFYPRPVMAFGYCRCLRLSVCVCACVCVYVFVSVNHQFVRTITCHPLKLQSPNLDLKCKTPWLRSLLFLRFIDLDLQGQFLT